MSSFNIFYLNGSCGSGKSFTIELLKKFIGQRLNYYDEEFTKSEKFKELKHIEDNLGVQKFIIDEKYNFIKNNSGANLMITRNPLYDLIFAKDVLNKTDFQDYSEYFAMKNWPGVTKRNIHDIYLEENLDTCKMRIKDNREKEEVNYIMKHIEKIDGLATIGEQKVITGESKILQIMDFIGSILSLGVSIKSPSIGEIRLVTGCMYAGKTTDLLQNYLSKKSCIIFRKKMSDDENYLYKNHNNSVYYAVNFTENDLETIIRIIKNFEFYNVFIDEVEFVNFIGEFVDRYDNTYNLYLYGLDYTYQGKLFEPIKNIYSKITEKRTLYSSCANEKDGKNGVKTFCGTIATRSHRIKKLDGIINIQKDEKGQLYIPVCERCFKELYNED